MSDCTVLPIWTFYITLILWRYLSSRRAYPRPSCNSYDYFLLWNSWNFYNNYIWLLCSLCCFVACFRVFRSTRGTVWLLWPADTNWVKVCYCILNPICDLAVWYVGRQGGVQTGVSYLEQILLRGKVINDWELSVTECHFGVARPILFSIPKVPCFLVDIDPSAYSVPKSFVEGCSI